MKFGIASFLCLILLFSCVDFGAIRNPEISGMDAEYALPLINSNISIGDLVTGSVDNTSIEVGTDGKVTVIYEGDLLRKTAVDVFPPIPGLGDFVLGDTVVNQSFIFSGGNEIDRGVFSGDKIHFKYRSNLEENVEVTMRIPEIQKDGEVFTQKVTLNYDGTLPIELVTPDVDLKGWELLSDDNSITFNYDARNEAGERIKLDKAWMNYSFIAFSYVEGFFPKTVYEIQGSFIPIGLYQNWIGGTMDFEDPKVTITLDNSFGFPVSTQVNDMHIKTLGWAVLFLESPFIESGISFEYPDINEIGVVKQTTFAFDTTNSNLQVIFNDRVRQLNYDIDAIANPEDDPNLVGYFTDSSFFNVNVAVEVPMHQKINNLHLVDTIEVDFSSFDGLSQAEFKLISESTFPVEVDLQIYFIDDTNTIIDSFFDTESMVLPSASIISEGQTMSAGEIIRILDFDVARMDNVKTTKRMAVETTISTINDGTESIWFYDDYTVGTKLGVKFKRSE